MKQSKSFFSKRKTAVIIAIAIIIILLLLLFLLRHEGVQALDPFEKWDLSVDAGSHPGNITSMSKDEIESELSERLEEGRMNISMNLNPVFRTGTSEGNVLIYNKESNRHPQIIEVSRADTGEKVYRSGLCPVGSSIENGKLLVDLDAGEYPCVAYFYAIDEDTATAVGRVGAEITITVLN